jgi:hypothetical protein
MKKEKEPSMKSVKTAMLTPCVAFDHPMIKRSIKSLKTAPSVSEHKPGYVCSELKEITTTTKKITESGAVIPQIFSFPSSGDCKSILKF